VHRRKRDQHSPKQFQLQAAEQPPIVASMPLGSNQAAAQQLRVPVERLAHMGGTLLPLRAGKQARSPAGSVLGTHRSSVAELTVAAADMPPAW